jgi:hypothetical protein
MAGLEAVAPMVTFPAVVTERLTVVLPPVNVIGLELHVPVVELSDTVVEPVYSDVQLLSRQACMVMTPAAQVAPVPV